MNEYHKIQTVYLRDPATKHRTLLEGQFAKPEFEYLKDAPWVFTEKVDGTNIRIQWDGGNTWRVGGRTDNAQIPAFLLDKLGELFSASRFAEVFDCPITLYGEGYGAKIQKGGGNYIPDGCSFVLFDVFCGDLWLERSNVEGIAANLGIDVVPIVHEGPLLEGVEIVRKGFGSRFGSKYFAAEGFVMRPKVELLNRRGERVISKIKCKDFAV